MKAQPRLRKSLESRLPPAARLWLKRMLVGSPRAIAATAGRFVTFSKRAMNFAVTRGLHLDPVWEIPKAPALPSMRSWREHDLRFLDQLREKLHPPESRAAPLASIIIPVFNKVDYTFECLTSLLGEIDLTRTEIIIIDNASTDETKQMLVCFADFVRVVENDENRGFVDACNQGAAVARGKYLIFLNNDIVVLPGWLTNLVDTIENDAAAGAVGSMFLYPDGSIQEAGAIIWKTGEVYHCGWGKSPDDRRYNFVREVDCCSGASLLVRKVLFEQLGGFDQRYAPAYYEDVDLCFGVRSLGYKVIYQPFSRVIHYEGATAGRDTQIGFKRYQIINREKLVEKWRVVLEREHCERDPAHEQRAANKNRGPAVIVFDDRVPTPDRDAGSARMLFILKTLARHYRTVFIYQSKPLASEYEQALWKEGIETANIVNYPRLLKEGDFQTALLSRPDVAAAVLRSIRRKAPGIRIVFDTVDICFLRLGMEHRVTGDAHFEKEAARYKKIEINLARASDLVWCTSPEDRKVLLDELPEKPIDIIPTIHSPQQRGQSFDDRRDLLFIGHFGHRPNSDAVHYFMKEIFPRLLDSIPDLKIHLVGSNAPPEIQAYASENVDLAGYVPDVTPLFNSVRILVAPLRFGAGVKGKIGEALAFGLPIVTTSVGAEGMGFQNGEQVLIADEPREFASAVVRLYEDGALWQRLADNGYAHVEKYFSPQAIERAILTSIDIVDPGTARFQRARDCE